MVKEVHTKIDVEASPQAVWHVLTDFAAYADWSPFIKSVEGRLVKGETLSFTVAVGKDKVVTAQARVEVVEPGRQLVWGGGLPFGLFRGQHVFRIDPRNGGVTFHNIERFSGLIAAMTIREPRLVMQRKAFEGFDSALKARAESANVGTAETRGRL